jgi:hypothetical protein
MAFDDPEGAGLMSQLDTYGRLRSPTATPPPLAFLDRRLAAPHGGPDAVSHGQSRPFKKKNLFIFWQAQVAKSDHIGIWPVVVQFWR